MEKKIALLFSDLEVGCHEYGFIDRRDEDTDDEDYRYERYLRGKGVVARVRDGFVLVSV